MSLILSKITKQKYVVIFLFLIVLYSCQPLLKTYLGIKKFEPVISNEDRLAYYEKFIENQEQLSIHIFKDSTINQISKQFDSYPNIHIVDNKNGGIYRLNCFEDVAWDIQNINEGNLDDLEVEKRERFQIIDTTLTKHTQQVFSKGKINAEGRWEVYMISGTFLGKKLRKKSLPINNLKDISSFTILDLSIESESFKEGTSAFLQKRKAEFPGE